ncbi:hypothetical protein AVEN_167979-1 [Araneus ventricosus]|uniref:Uncharacterized protein n=1 Tax=Araneus ventricosus TaxID=182803 RepID=A0A4Y2PSE5_ARAVE|nr:hypothetical protein AVEN_167979-1 [Araneus ventricosus]
MFSNWLGTFFSEFHNSIGDSANEPANFIKSTSVDPAFASPESNLDVAASFSKETPNEVGEISTENQTVSSLKISKDLPLFKESNTIQQGLSEITESSESMQSIVTEEAESTEVIQSVLPEETESTEIIQSVLAEKTKSTQIIQSALSVQTEVIQTPVSEETASTIVNQPILPEKTESPESIQPANSEEIELTEVKQPVLSVINLNKVIPFDSLESSCSTKALISSSESKKARLPSNDMINPSNVPEIASKKFQKWLLIFSIMKKI